MTLKDLMHAIGSIDNPTARVLADVTDERRRQDAKWGECNHDPFIFLAVLGEEVGEANQAALQLKYEGGDVEHLREELVQVAAAAAKFIEALDRGVWKWGE